MKLEELQSLIQEVKDYAGTLEERIKVLESQTPQVVSFVNDLKNAVGNAFSQVEVRLTAVEGSSPAQRVVNAAIAALTAEQAAKEADKRVQATLTEAMKRMAPKGPQGVVPGQQDDGALKGAPSEG